MSKKNEFFVFILYKIVYDCVYIFVTTREFEYMQSILNLNIYKYLINWIVFIIFLIYIINIYSENLMTFVIKSLFMFSIVPTISLYGLKEMNNTAFFLMMLYWIVILCSFTLLKNLKIKSNQAKRLNSQLSIKYINILFISTFIITILLWGVLGDFGIITSLSSVSESRLALREVNIPSIIRYLMIWVGNVFLPLCFAMYLKHKKYGRVILTFIAGIMIFSINGLKTWLIIYPMIITIFVIYNNKYKLNRYTSVLASLVSIFGVMGLFGYIFFDNVTFAAFYHRVFSIPAEINYDFYTFFSVREPLLLRESILRHFAVSPYGGNSTFIIGALFSGNSEANSNNGMFGDAYANFKVFGILVYPIIIAFIFKIFITTTINEDQRVIVSILLVLIWNLVNASFFVWVLSGGVIIFLFIFLFGVKEKLK